MQQKWILFGQWENIKSHTMHLNLQKMGFGIFDCRCYNFCHLLLYWLCIGIVIKDAVVILNEPI